MTYGFCSVERGDRNEFVGRDARQHFFDLFQSESRWMNAEGSSTSSREAGGGSMLDSARGTLLKTCSDLHVLPMPLIIGRESERSVFNGRILICY